nr:SPOR domain-containing protein [Jannaschia formosa]
MIAARALAAKRAAEQAAAEAAAVEAAPETTVVGAAAPEVSASSLDAPATAEQAALSGSGPTAVEATRTAPRRRGLALLFGRRNAVGAPEPLPAGLYSGPPLSFVQIGLFDEQTSARAAAERLASAGVLPSIRQQGDNWRVLVGPAPSDEDRAAVLRKAKDLGFSDAYPVAG